MIDQNGDRVELLENKMIILDFWTTNCGVCFKKFPDFERIMKKYDSNSNIVFYAVNMPIKRDTFPETVALVNKLNYSFKTLYAIDRKAIEHQMNFNLYPQIIVVKNNKIVYSGGFNSGKAIFISNLESIIEKNK